MKPTPKPQEPACLVCGRGKSYTGFDCWTCKGDFCRAHILGRISGNGEAPQQCADCRPKHKTKRKVTT